MNSADAALVHIDPRSLYYNLLRGFVLMTQTIRAAPARIVDAPRSFVALILEAEDAHTGRFRLVAHVYIHASFQFSDTVAGWVRGTAPILTVVIDELTIRASEF